LGEIIDEEEKDYDKLHIYSSEHHSWIRDESEELDGRPIKPSTIY